MGVSEDQSQPHKSHRSHKSGAKVKKNKKNKEAASKKQNPKVWKHLYFNFPDLISAELMMSCYDLFFFPYRRLLSIHQ